MGQVGVEEGPPLGPEGSPGPPGMCQPKGQAGEGTDSWPGSPVTLHRASRFASRTTMWGRDCQARRPPATFTGPENPLPGPKPRISTALGKRRPSSTRLAEWL